jgi:hypothetical protein
MAEERVIEPEQNAPRRRLASERFNVGIHDEGRGDLAAQRS